jgi:hypothetical protein
LVVSGEHYLVGGGWLCSENFYFGQPQGGFPRRFVHPGGLVDLDRPDLDWPAEQWKKKAAARRGGGEDETRLRVDVYGRAPLARALAMAL